MSADLHTLSYSMSNESGEKTAIPFLKKDLLYTPDQNNSTNYSRNEVTFSTTSISNNGKWIDYKNGIISIPLVMRIERDAGHALSAADAKQMLQLKGSNLSILDSCQIEYNGVTVVQQTRNISPLLIFKQHSTLGLNDVALHGHHIGYQKHSSEDWSYEDTVGMKNDTDMTSKFFHDIKNAVVQSNANLKASGSNFQEANGLNHYFHYDCMIRLKDFSFFEKMPLVRGAKINITLTLNQGLVSTTVAGGAKTAVNSSLSGSLFPVIRKAGGEVADYNETISVTVCENNGVIHQKKECRLYTPAYTFEPSHEAKYLSLGSKKILYEDIFYTKLKNLSGEFSNTLTTSRSRMKRLVLVPYLSAASNGTLGVEPTISPYCADAVATCSPHLISNFNVRVAGSNLYQSNITYKYEHYLNELNGKQGVNAGMEDGFSSGQISLKDYESNYGYIVCDLSRRYEYDENIGMSLDIQGTITSGKALNFHCYIEYEKDITLDITTGEIM